MASSSGGVSGRAGSRSAGRSARRLSTGSMQAPVDLVELEPARLPMPPRQSRPPPPLPPSLPPSQRSADEASALLLSSSRALYSSPMRPSQYAPRPSAPPPTKTSTEDAAKESEERREQRRQMAERVSLEQALLRRRWRAHSVSALFHFRRESLSAYAHELVKALRATAQRASGQQFGYSVSIRNADDACVVFLVREDRRAPRRRASMSAATAAAAAAAGHAESRTAAFVLFLPAERERRASRKGREEQQVLLLRGNEQLLAWSCSWLQRSFQCVVDTRPVRVSELNLRRLARNLAVSSLMEQRTAAGAAAARPSQQQQEEEQTPGEEADPATDDDDAKPQARAPLVLQFRNPDARGAMQTYTLTVPWESLRRIYDKASTSGAGENSSPNGAVPEIVEMAERAYFDSLPFDRSAFSLARFEMEELAMSRSGEVEFYDLSLVHAALFSLYELLAIQDAPGPRRPTATF